MTRKAVSLAVHRDNVMILFDDGSIDVLMYDEFYNMYSNVYTIQARAR